MKTAPFSIPPTHLVHLDPKLFQPLELVQFQTNLIPLQMITNQLNKKCNLRMTIMLLGPSVRYQHFQYQLINLVCLSFDFFSFS